MIAKATLNPQAWEIEETESEIRRLVIDGILQGKTRNELNQAVGKTLNSSLKKIVIPELRVAARKSLIQFYNRQYSTATRLYGGNIPVLLSLVSLTERSKSEREREKIYEKLPETVKDDFKMTVNQYGVPNKEFMENYVSEKVKPTLDALCQQFALDPDDVSGSNSLRNRAEMEVRYSKHLNDIAGLRAAGVKLVIASTHADCSKRCAEFQGRVYSLDGTSGTTDDGRSYVPLEVATDVIYTTKTGKSYKNGLLGFNCRHYLVEYKTGYQFPKPDAKKEKEEYAITVKQRYLERQVRRWKVEALESRLTDKKRYSIALSKSRYWNQVYENFSKKNDRAFYRSRIQIA